MKSNIQIESASEDETLLGQEMQGEASSDSSQENKNGQPAAQPEIQTSEGDIGKAMGAKKNRDLTLVRKAEAALFLANRTVSLDELSKLLETSRGNARNLVELLRSEYENREGAIEVVLGEAGVMLQVKPQFLQGVSELSRKPDLSRKATKILALVAKKGGLMQSELKKYFKGEIYEYTTELKRSGYIESEKRGNTRYLKPSKKFTESFQLA